MDAVVLFDEETPLALIELLRPDVLVKEPTTDSKRWSARSWFKGMAVSVLLAELEPGYSTTGTIDVLRRS